ncbi:MAG: SNF2-related protein [Actinomycetes bacterium]
MVTDWSQDLNDFTIRRTVGPKAFANGRSYARGGRVSELTVDPAGRLLTAAVQGTRNSPYRVVVTPAPGAARWSGSCSCPVAINCKHVAAVMLAGRMRGDAVLVATPRSWETPLTALVRARTTKREPAGAALALQLEVAGPTPRFTRYGEPSPRPGGVRVRIRPVTRSRAGGWVRTGVSWRDLQYDVGRRGFDRSHRDLLRAFAAAYMANGGGRNGYGYDIAVHLDDLGPELWQLLARAGECGLDLVPAKASAGPIRVAPPVGVALDLRRADGTGAVLRPVVAAGDETLDVGGVELIGEPAHGLFVTDPAGIDVMAGSTSYDDAPRPGLVLAPLDTSPDEQVSELLREGRALEIPEGDLARFLTGYYPALRQAITVVSADGSVELPEVLPPRLALTVTFRPDHEVGVDWGFAYAVEDGDERIPYDDDGLHCGEVLRDRSAEQQLIDRLDDATRRLLAPDLLLTGMDSVSFTHDQLPVLRDIESLDLTVVGDAPDFRQAEMPPVIRLSAEDATDAPDWFDLGVAVSVDGEEIPLDQLIVALAGGQSHLVLASGTYFTLDRPELETLRRLIEEARALQDRASDGLRVSIYQAGLWEELLELGVVQTQSARWAGTVQGLLDLRSLAPPPMPVGFDADLRPYQLDGYQWLAFLWQHGLGGVLADDMGLGKTVQTLAMVCHAREGDALPGPFLVVAPTSVVGNWVHEARRFAPGLKVCAVTETSAKRCTPLAEDVAGADVVVTSYALFRIDFEAYLGLEWAGLILDEAQAVKNHQAKTYQCARRLPAPFKLAVTGTPLENSLMDLWSLLSIVAPGLYPSPQRFSDVFRRPIERGEDPELLATLRRRVRPLMLRRTKDQVVADLPPKQEQVLDVVLNPKHEKVYQTHLQRERQKVLKLLDDLDGNRFEIFRSLTLLRQLSLDPGLVDPTYGHVSSSKADAFLDQLREVVGEGHRALVFSQFTGFLKVIRDRLDAEGIAYSYLDGRTRKRAARIEEFKTGDAPVFLISLKAGGVGLNLTEADYCFILDPWWNPAVEAQAVDRTHRIGQDKPVMVYRLVAVGTIEEKVMELKARKQALFARVMDDDALMSAPLSVDDIKGLFG